MVDDIHGILDEFGMTVPRLQHGDGDVTWTLLEDAIRRGVDTRVGFEDTLYGPNGARASGNAALVRGGARTGGWSLSATISAMFSIQRLVPSPSPSTTAVERRSLVKVGETSAAPPRRPDAIVHMHRRGPGAGD
jgi:beta-keto acid cleavage enzyme